MKPWNRGVLTQRRGAPGPAGQPPGQAGQGAKRTSIDKGRNGQKAVARATASLQESLREPQRAVHRAGPPAPRAVAPMCEEEVSSSPMSQSSQGSEPGRFPSLPSSSSSNGSGGGSSGSGRPHSAATSLALEPEGPGLPSTVSSAQILAPVRGDMQQMTQNLKAVAGNRHPTLMAAAEQIFGAGGKKLRPALVFLVARATAALAGRRDICDKQRRLAEITEMIHTASLVHDDVLDESSVRRGKATVNSKFGTKIAVLAGDFLFAQSSWYLANLDNLEVIKLISQVIADFADGEISQSQALFNTGLTLQQYMDKCFHKTATLIAASCKSAAVFSGVGPQVNEAMFEYGRHLGLAFQVVDDILDFTQTEAQLGKPQGQDLRSGNLTAPVVFALGHPTHGPELAALIEDEYGEGEEGVARALALVEQGGGLAGAKRLARQEADLALEALECLPASEAKQSLELMVEYVLDRLF